MLSCSTHHTTPHRSGQQATIVVDHDERWHEVNQLAERAHPDTMFDEFSLHDGQINWSAQLNNANCAKDAYRMDSMKESSQQITEKSFWSLTPENALLNLDSTTQGLSEKTAQDRLKQYGPNSLKGGSRTSALMLFLLQFKSPVTLLLIFAAGLSFALHDKTDASIILVIVLVSGLLGWWQEKGATNAIDQLMKMVHNWLVCGYGIVA